MIKGRGPRIKPWGTPVVTEEGWEVKDFRPRPHRGDFLVKGHKSSVFWPTVQTDAADPVQIKTDLCGSVLGFVWTPQT